MARPPGNPNWRKGGPSPNPGGRPKGPDRFRQLYDESLCDDRIFKRLMQILEAEDDARSSLKAAEMLMDRRYGKIPTVDDDGNIVDQKITVVVPNYTDDTQ